MTGGGDSERRRRRRLSVGAKFVRRRSLARARVSARLVRDRSVYAPSTRRDARASSIRARSCPPSASSLVTGTHEGSVSRQCWCPVCARSAPPPPPTASAADTRPRRTATSCPRPDGKHRGLPPVSAPHAPMAARRSTETHDRRHMRCMGGGGSMTSDRESRARRDLGEERRRVAFGRQVSGRQRDAREPRSPPARAPLATRASAAGRPSGTSASTRWGSRRGCTPCARRRTPAPRTARPPPRATSPPGRATPPAGPAGTRAPPPPPRVTAPDLRSAATASASPGGAPENTALTTRSANATAHAVGRAQSRPVLSADLAGVPEERVLFARPGGSVGAERRARREPRVQVQVARRGEAERRIAVIKSHAVARRARRREVRAQREVLGELARAPGEDRGLDQRQDVRVPVRPRSTPGGSGADGGTPSACPAWWRSLSAGVYHGKRVGSGRGRVRRRARRRAPGFAEPRPRLRRRGAEIRAPQVGDGEIIAMIIARPGAIDRFVIVIVIVIVIASLRRPHCNSLQLVQPSEPLHSRGAVVEERDRRRVRVHAEKAPVGAAVAPRARRGA